MTDRWLRAGPPLAAAVYPGLVWCGPALWRPLLAVTLVVPAIAVWASVRLAEGEARAARAVALAAVGAPALFSLLGGLLDFQRAIPLTSVTAWIPLWLVLAAIAWREPRTVTSSGSPASPPRPSRLAIAHGIVALPIVAFALAHLANHLSGAAGGAAHLAVMGALRRVYRHPYVEPVLLACIGLQVIGGLVLVGRRLARRATPIETVQSASGAYLALFFASHLTAVLRARSRGVETDWHWLTESDLFRDPWSARLVPYYVLAVIAIASHLACAVRAVAIGHGARRDGWGWLLAAAAGIGAAASAVIMAALAG
jgi:hypothetical protein